MPDWPSGVDVGLVFCLSKKKKSGCSTAVLCSSSSSRGGGGSDIPRQTMGDGGVQSLGGRGAPQNRCHERLRVKGQEEEKYDREMEFEAGVGLGLWHSDRT